MPYELTLGSLFSGIGLLDLGLERAGMKTIWQCESDKHASKLLEKRLGVPNYNDVMKIDWSEVERPDILAGGFPCQPFSNAGLRKGESDDRYLWPEFARAVRSLQPRIVIVENVAALLRKPEWGTVLGDLAEAGYDAKWACIRASDVGAPHRRERVFIAAYSCGKPSRRNAGTTSTAETLGQDAADKSYYHGPGYGNQASAYTDSKRHENKRPKTERISEPSSVDFGPYQDAIRRWEQLTRPVPEPTDDRGRLSVRFVEWMMGAPDGWTDGMSRTQAIKGLGNGVVVQVAEAVGNWVLQDAI